MVQPRWTLSTCAVAGVASFTLALLLVSSCLLAFVANLPRSRFETEDDRPWVITANSLRLFNIIQASLGMAGYVIVSYGKPRPLQLHMCMLVVLLILPGQTLSLVASILHLARKHVFLWSVSIAFYLNCGIRKTILYLVVKQKLKVLASPGAGCRGACRWVDGMIVSNALAVLIGNAVWSFAIALHAGERSLEAPASVALNRSGEFSVVEVTVMRFLFLTGKLSVLFYVVAGIVVLFLARNLVRTTVRRLASRGATATMLSKVRHTLRMHLLGMVVSIGTGCITIVAAVVNICNALGVEAAEDAFSAMLSAMDVGGDVAGLLLLSGIWELLFRDDPEAGDFNHSIRSLLRSTVLTSRAERVFEGSLQPTPNNMCIVSFPGKFIEDWNELTWLCEQRELSSACVFLPTSDPGKRFGKHAQCPEDLTNRCWCYQLYGEEKPWGCQWFAAWRDNIEKAVGLGLELVVVFFPGQAGRGVVEWADLPTADLWDGLGLGGSQKAEVAFLRRRGVKYMELDLEEARRLCLSRYRETSTWPRSPFSR